MSKHYEASLVFILFLLLARNAIPQTATDLQARRDFFKPENRSVKFQSADQSHPKREVKASGEVWHLSSTSSSKKFAPSYLWEGKEYNLAEFHKRTHTNAMLILKEGRIVYEAYFNGASEKTRFISFSTGKSIVSILLGMAIEDGHIKSVDDPLTRYLPALVGSAYETVSIKDAIQMVSGVDFEPNIDETFDPENMFNRFAKARKDAMVEHRYRFVEAANSLRRKRPVGVKFEYNNMNAALVGWVIENATRQRLATYMQKRMWQPAGMEFDAAWLLDGPEELGRELAPGDFVATLRDYGRFSLMVLNGGKANGKQLVSSDWIRESTTPNRPPVQYGELSKGYPLGYGYQWWLRPNGHFVAQGVYGQLFYIAPEANIAVVKLSHWPDAWVPAIEMECYEFFKAVIGELELSTKGD